MATTKAPAIGLSLRLEQRPMICDSCGDGVSSADGMLHTVERSTVGTREEYFAFYRWNDAAADSGAFNFVHSREACVVAQAMKYLDSGLVWGIVPCRVPGLRIIASSSMAVRS